MLGAARREIPMRRTLPVLGWLIAALYFGAVAALNFGIVVDLYRPPEGPWPGWWPLIEADALYGGGGLLVVILVRLAWRRLEIAPGRNWLRSGT
jgi:hypothetical protein